MKFLKANITTILIIAVAVLITILVVGMFRKTPVDSLYKERIADKEAIIKAKDETIVVLAQANEDKDRSIESHERTDSLLAIALTNNKPKYIANDKKLQDVSHSVANLDKEQLRRELSGF